MLVPEKNLYGTWTDSAEERGIDRMSGERGKIRNSVTSRGAFLLAAFNIPQHPQPETKIFHLPIDCASDSQIHDFSRSTRVTSAVEKALECSANNEDQQRPISQEHAHGGSKLR